MANHLESGGLAGRVHVSQATAKYLADSYELEPADGHLRDGYIRQAGLETFFIRQTEPSCKPESRLKQPPCRPARSEQQTEQHNLESDVKPRRAILVKVCDSVKVAAQEQSELLAIASNATIAKSKPTPKAARDESRCSSALANIGFSIQTASSTTDDDDEDEEEEENDGENWQPEIPFKNLNVAEAKPISESISAHILLDEHQPEQQHQQQVEDAAGPAANSSKSMSSLLRSSFRRDRNKPISATVTTTASQATTTSSSATATTRQQACSDNQLISSDEHRSFVKSHLQLESSQQLCQLPEAGSVDGSCNSGQKWSGLGCDTQLNEQPDNNNNKGKLLPATGKARKSSLVCIKITDDSGSTLARNGSDKSSARNMIDSMIVTCPAAADEPSAKSCASSTSAQWATRSSPIRYSLLFLRLFRSKLRRSGCCGLGGRSKGAHSNTRFSADSKRRRHRRTARQRSRRAAEPSQWGSRDSSSLGTSSIEVEISRRMMKEHINWFRLTFKSSALEDAYCQIRYTTSKSNIVYIFITWLLMALVSLLSLPNLWQTLKVVLVATVPLLAFACFYMSDSILYNSYMNYKLKEAISTQRRSQSLKRRQTGEQQPATQQVEPAQTDKQQLSDNQINSASPTRTGSQHKVAPLVHRVARFWSKLDRIPMIWNFFIFSFNLIMTVAFLKMNFFACRKSLADASLGESLLDCNRIKSASSSHPNWANSSHLQRLCSGQVSAELAEKSQEFSCIHQDNLMFGIILIMIEMGSFFRSSYLRKVILLGSLASAFMLVFHWIFTYHQTPLSWLAANASQSLAWSTFNVAYDRSACALVSIHPDAPPTKLSYLLHENIVEPLAASGLSQCDRQMFEKSLIIIAVMFIGLVYVCRSTERISRLDFLWKLQASKELQDMRALRHYNTQLLENILPDHVAAHFLQDERNSEELYAKSYPCVAVLFASIPNFSSFYSEDINNGMECIRLLNEIIFDFDQLLDDDQFRSIEKVKTISSTYLAACGLNPRDQSLPPSHHLSVCCNFAFAMKKALGELNVHSFNNFVMRIGISHGPLVGGVIGAKKPVFDIWGDTVNEASRMDSTGTLDKIQVPKRSAEILAAEGFVVHCRGVIPVKGKGDMETYYVLEKPPTVSQASLGEIVVPVVATSVKVDAQLKQTSSIKNREPIDIHTQASGCEKPDKSETRKEQQLLSLQDRRFNRLARNSQSMRNPSSNRRQLRGGRQHLANELELSHLANQALSFDERQTTQRSFSGERAFGVRNSTGFTPETEPSSSRLRSGSPGAQFDSGILERLLIHEQRNSVEAGDHNSLTAVVFNMVKMRQNYDHPHSKLASNPSLNANSHDLSNEAAKFVSDSMNDPTSSLSPARLNQSGILARPRSANATRKSTRNKSSLFRRRSNYKRAGTSEVGAEYGPTEESIHENE